MFYRNISRYINKLCGWLQRLVVIARFQCIKLITQTVIREKEKKEKDYVLLSPHWYLPESARKD